MITGPSVAVAAGPQPELPLRGGTAQAPPQTLGWIPPRQAPPPPAVLGGKTGVALLPVGRLSAPRSGVVGLHRGGTPTP